MPSWLQGFAMHQPITVLSDALRGLFHVNPTLTTADTRWALIQSAGWIIAILAVFVPLSVMQYRRSTAR
jgi:ABC-2 type transport system permease protein/oleandomycin transport system permease protein